MDQQPSRRSNGNGNVYTFDGQMLIIASIVAVLVFIVLLVTLHLYARWWLRHGPVSHIFLVTDNNPPPDHALHTHILNSLPVFTYSSAAPDLECAVCLSEFKENEIGRLLPKCNHSFHTDCIDMWFHSHSTCPLCRSLVEAVPQLASASGLCDTCQQEESSVSRMLSFKSLDLDLEGGLREAIRVSTPK